MKKFIYTLFSLAFVLLFSSTVFADTPPPDTHQLIRCVKIVNLDKFPDIYIIGFVTDRITDSIGQSRSGHKINHKETLNGGRKSLLSLSKKFSNKVSHKVEPKAYIYKKDECLPTNQLIEILVVLAAKKSYIDSIGINNLNLQSEWVQIPGECPFGCYLRKFSDKNLFVSNEKIDTSRGYVDNSNPLIGETIEYSIAGYSNGKLFLDKSKQTSKYRNGTPKNVETFGNPLIESTPGPSQEPAKSGFWQSIICFFRGCQ